MNATFKYIFVGLLLSLFGSCTVIEIQTVQPEIERESALVTFTLAMQQAGTTKADDYSWDQGDYDMIVGTDFENNINTSSVKVFAYLVTADAVSFVSEVPILQCTTDSDGQTEFTGFLPHGVETGQTYRFVVIANCTDQSYGLTYNANGIPVLDDLVFNAPSHAEIANMTSVIPMYGITSHTITSATTDIDLDTVWMLRSLAKVEVTLSQALKDEGYSIGSAWINVSNSSGYCLPTGWYSVEMTQNLKHDGAFRPYLSATSSNVNLISSSDTMYLYLPEVENSTENPLSIGLSVNKTTTVDGVQTSALFETYDEGIKFCNYATDGTATSDIFHIVRNHIYRFTVTALNQPADLDLIITINPWNNRDVTYGNTYLTE